jgi:histidyl-tRNA synthetase
LDADELNGRNIQNFDLIQYLLRGRFLLVNKSEGDSVSDPDVEKYVATARYVSHIGIFGRIEANARQNMETVSFTGYEAVKNFYNKYNFGTIKNELTGSINHVKADIEKAENQIKAISEGRATDKEIVNRASSIMKILTASSKAYQYLPGIINNILDVTDMYLRELLSILDPHSAEE